jgi:hypothetical protein
MMVLDGAVVEAFGQLSLMKLVTTHYNVFGRSRGDYPMNSVRFFASPWLMRPMNKGER